MHGGALEPVVGEHEYVPRVKREGVARVRKETGELRRVDDRSEEAAAGGLSLLEVALAWGFIFSLFHKSAVSGNNAFFR